jgi:hypothetical protein
MCPEKGFDLLSDMMGMEMLLLLEPGNDFPLT